MFKNKEKGDLTEQKFKEWLDKHRIPYWYIQQDIETFSTSLKDYFCKRPDFMILIPNFGFILVDIENKEPARKYNKFFIDAEEAIKYSQLQRFFNLQVWYVFSNEKYHFNTWFWIPVSKVLELGREYKSKTNGKGYFSVSLDDLHQVASSDSLDRVFSQMLK